MTIIVTSETPIEECVTQDGLNCFNSKEFCQFNYYEGGRSGAGPDYFHTIEYGRVLYSLCRNNDDPPQLPVDSLEHGFNYTARHSSLETLIRMLELDRRLWYFSIDKYIQLKIDKEVDQKTPENLKRIEIAKIKDLKRSLYFREEAMNPDSSRVEFANYLLQIIEQLSR